MAVSKRAKALSIPKGVKDRVFARDGGNCVWCGSNQGMPEAHFIPRTRGGLGVEENILTLCRLPLSPGKQSCHDMFDKGSALVRETMRDFFAAYLKFHYPGWDEKNLTYKKEQ